ncbi:ATP-dependent RNA helicase vasa-like [Periplaneta americana]|uniref:ATP-dependent RNA helicase vasa-like n=1 Tax=Periplaneta americana TaxID=6978 RepID=UPI0037E93EBF
MSFYDECWDDGDNAQMSINSIDTGTNFGRGRGFLPLERISNHDNSVGYKNGSSDGNSNESEKIFSFIGERGGRGNKSGGRGRGHGRGRGRGSRGGRGGLFQDGSGFQNRKVERNTTDHGTRGRRGKEGVDHTEKPREVYIPPEPTDDEDTMFTGGISTGMNFDKYDFIQVKVTGENVPLPIERFENSGLRQLLMDNITKSGYTRPTPVQKNAIPIIMGGRDLMACAQTGSGKTAAFLLPIIHMILNDPKDLIVTAEHCEPHAVIVSPTRELTLQIFNEARKFSHGSFIRTVVAYGGAASYHQAQQAAKGCHILVATPGRLLDFMDKGRITFSSLRFLVLDEADRMLDMGFMPDIERMLNHSSMVATGIRQTLMFSATFPEDIQRLAGKFLSNYLFLAVGVVGSACSDVEQNFHLVPKFEKRPKLTELIAKENGEKTLVFVEMKRTADFIAAYLSEHDFPTTSIHGDRLQREREEALADFKNGRMAVLVATAVAARGLDIKNVSHVINYDLPKSIDEYVHRIGRTGRVGNRGKATSFYDPEMDGPLAKDLLKILQQADQEIPSWLEKEAENAIHTSFSSRSGRFGGKDFRKFENQECDSSAVFSSPQPIEEEEVWG